MKQALHIVIAEDDDQVRMLLVQVVQRCHPEAAITAVDNGQTAFQICCTRTVDFLITDNRMPGMLGIDLIQELRVRQETFPILLLSGDTIDDTESLSYSITRLITKPIDVAGLCRVVAELLACVSEMSVATQCEKLYNRTVPDSGRHEENSQ